MSVRISAALPKGDGDGLQPFERELLAMREPLMIVGIVYPRSIIDRLDDKEDEHIVVLGIRQVEVLSGDEAMAADALLGGAFERRTGKVPLPFGSVLPDDES